MIHIHNLFCLIYITYSFQNALSICIALIVRFVLNISAGLTLFSKFRESEFECWVKKFQKI